MIEPSFVRFFASTKQGGHRLGCKLHHVTRGHEQSIFPAESHSSYEPSCSVNPQPVGYYYKPTPIHTGEVQKCNQCAYRHGLQYALCSVVHKACSSRYLREGYVLSLFILREGFCKKVA